MICADCSLANSVTDAKPLSLRLCCNSDIRHLSSVVRRRAIPRLGYAEPLPLAAAPLRVPVGAIPITVSGEFRGRGTAIAAVTPAIRVPVSVAVRGIVVVIARAAAPGQSVQNNSGRPDMRR